MQSSCNSNSSPIENTLIYTQLFSFESYEYRAKTAKKIEEASQLIENVFEYFTETDDFELFRKRK